MDEEFCDDVATTSIIAALQTIVEDAKILYIASKKTHLHTADAFMQKPIKPDLLQEILKLFQ